MEVMRIVGIGLIGAILSILLRNSKPEFSMLIPVVVSFTVLACAMPYLIRITEELSRMASSAGINSSYMRIDYKSYRNILSCVYYSRVMQGCR